MILGTGIDIIEVERTQRAAAKAGFAERVFTVEERALIAKRRNDAQTIAGIFAAKEAVAKALGRGFFGGMSFQDVEILHEPSGRPVARLRGAAAERLLELNATQVFVSISHIKAVAVANAIITDGQGV
ncbi:MAG: holo-ACP synthase [Christensenellaceae bacterium]|jgi:holo-[acyl-carrier protein] synthase|nr:holo-ACP synthase [Christensenellaceae bacterium]